MRKARLRALTRFLGYDKLIEHESRNEESPIEGIDTYAENLLPPYHIRRNEESPIEGIDTP